MHFSCLNGISYLWWVSSLSLSTLSLASVNQPFFFYTVYLWGECLCIPFISESLWYLSFCDWFISFYTPKFILVAINSTISFLKEDHYSNMFGTPFSLSIHLMTDSNLDSISSLLGIMMWRTWGWDISMTNCLQRQFHSASPSLQLRYFFP